MWGAGVSETSKSPAAENYCVGPAVNHCPMDEPEMFSLKRCFSLFKEDT